MKWNVIFLTSLLAFFQSQAIPKVAQKLAFGNPGAPDLQSAKQAMCRHMADGAGCKDGDAGAVESQLLSHIRYSAQSNTDGEDNKGELKPALNPSPSRPNHIYLGAEAFVFDLDTHIKKINVYGTKVFEGLRIRYEYLKPKAFYAGIDLFSGRGNKSFHAKQQDMQLPGNSSSSGFGCYELRFGYAIPTAKNGFVAPFLAFGAYYVGNHGHHFHFQETMLYYATGIRALFEVRPWFHLGLNGKIFNNFFSEKKIKLKTDHLTTLKDHDQSWGGEIGLPFIWFMDSAKKWEVQFEPYFLKLDFSQTQNIYGTRLLFGYRF